MNYIFGGAKLQNSTPEVNVLILSKVIILPWAFHKGFKTALEVEARKNIV